uniref:Uncharacterized protein n=2 Tax=Parasteatoda tepidariorum TaxID=114398 RepID=A0A2L2YE43_PARTP
MEFNEQWFDTCSKVGCAAKVGNIKLLKQLIKENCPVDVADNRGWKPLHEAAAIPPTEECLAELLKHEKTDINWQTHEGESALLLACKRRQGSTANEFVKLLLQHGADPNIPDNESDTPLLQALRNKNEFLVEKLVVAGADVNATDCSGWSPLHQAASSKNPTLVNFLLKNGANIDARDECKLTPVFSAAQHGCEKSLKALLDAAKEKGNLHIVVNMGAEDWATPLMIAAQQGFEACVKLLLDYGADPNLKTSDNATALHMAVQANNTTCLEILLQNMFLKPIIQAFHPETYIYSGMICPLHLAIEWKNHASLKVLLEAGFAPDSLYDCRDSVQVTRIPYLCFPECESALSFACFKKDTMSIAVLLSSGADPSPPVETAYHPAMRAINVHNIEALQILIESGTNLNYQRKEFPSNEVFLSALLSTQDILRLLLYHGCDPNLCFQIKNDYCFQRCASRYIKRNGLTLREFLRVILPYLVVSPHMQTSLDALSKRYPENVRDIIEEIGQPSPLQQLCVIQIRQHLYSVHRNKLPFVIHQLNLPHLLTQLISCSSQ